MDLPAKITGFIVSPMDAQGNACTPDYADTWAIHARNADHETYAGSREINELSAVLADLLAAYPGTEDNLVVRWIGEDGKPASVGPGTAEVLINHLMEVVCDETPDDADNTDDHPLEGMRTVLDDVQTLLEQRAAATPGA